MYAMNHNATGYSEDMNPVMIDGIQNPRDARAVTREAMVQSALLSAARAQELGVPIFIHPTTPLGAAVMQEWRLAIILGFEFDIVLSATRLASAERRPPSSAIARRNAIPVSVSGRASASGRRPSLR